METGGVDRLLGREPYWHLARRLLATPRPTSGRLPGFPKVDKDGKEIKPQEVMERVGPYACRLARLVETDEFVKDEVAPEDAGKEFLAC